MYIALQLHITGRCNLACRHCYMEKCNNELPYGTVKTVIRQYRELLKNTGKIYGKKVEGQIRITGGEPLLHRDFKKILRLLKRIHIPFVLMTNGTLANDVILQKLKRAGLSGCQVSLDGIKSTHDDIRGDGNFDAVISALKRMSAKGIPSRVSFTANSENYTEFPQIASICRECGVKSLWSDRYIPSSERDLRTLNKEQTHQYIEILERERLNPENAEAGLSIENGRALQFLASDRFPYTCKAGDNLIVVDERGDILPCRRLPIVCGNIANTTLSKVYFQHPTFLELQEHPIPSECKQCKHSSLCRGGARCLSYALSKKFDRCDPGCFLSTPAE